MIHLSAKLYNFEKCIMKIYTPKTKWKYRGRAIKNKQHTRKLQCNNKICHLGVFKGRLKFLGVFRHTVTKPQNTCTTQLASPVVFKYLIPNPGKIGSKSFIIPLCA